MKKHPEGGYKHSLSTAKLWRDILKIRSEAPLIHNITNYVVMNSTANALLALGASPVMAHALEEMDEMIDLVRALVINIGTLSTPWISAMLKAGIRAKGKGIPIVLDPVGSGATSFRTTSALQILREVKPDIVRGNASEILSLVSSEKGTKGVDSTHKTEETVDKARLLATHYNCVVSMSGATDVIVSADRTVRVFNGHPIMPRITGLGCSATTLTAAFATVNPDPVEAAVHAMALMGIAGELAGEKSPGPGSFQVQFLDALHAIGENDMRRLRAAEEDPRKV
jgi:hydroxyethylthiazole kinase